MPLAAGCRSCARSLPTRPERARDLSAPHSARSAQGSGLVGPANTANEPASPLAWKRSAALAAALVGYWLAMGWLGYLVPTFLLAWGMMVWLELRQAAALVAAGVLVGLIWVLFGQVFQVALPRGVWGGLP